MTTLSVYINLLNNLIDGISKREIKSIQNVTKKVLSKPLQNLTRVLLPSPNRSIKVNTNS